MQIFTLCSFSVILVFSVFFCNWSDIHTTGLASKSTEMNLLLSLARYYVCACNFSQDLQHPLMKSKLRRHRKL